jgi:bacteriocin-like protein
MKMSERLLEEPIELTDAELDAVSGGIQSVNGWIHEDTRTI